MKLTLLSADAGVTQVQCEGDVTQNDLWDCADPLERLLGASGFAGKVLVSMARANFIDSAGVGWFIVCHKHFREAGGKMVLHSIPPMIHNIFQLLQMHTVLHLAKDETAALALAQGDKP
jgi:anti-anti-sigma factor